MIDVTIYLKCSKKPGTLSRLIRDIKLFGLIYSSHDIQHQHDFNMITVHGTGELNCGRNRLIEVLNDLPEVLSINSVRITQNGLAIEQVETQTSNVLIHPQETITPAILLTAEKRLAEIIGPIAGYLVETAKLNSQDTGELFQALADELSTEMEQKEFLSIIET